MKKNLNKLATLALTGMMVAGMSFGAMAATNTAGSGSFTKKLSVDGKTFAPNTTFTFTKTALTDDEVKTTFAGKEFGSDKKDLANYLKGTTETQIAGITVSGATFTAEQGTTDKERAQLNEDDLKDEYSAAVNITVNAGLFTEPGMYVMGLKEDNAPAYEGVDYDTTQYYLLINVRNKSDGTALEVASVQLFDANGVKYDHITNGYGGSERTDKVYDLSVEKVITGLGAKLDGEFTFQVGVTAPEASKDGGYAVYKDGTYFTTISESKTADLTVTNNTKYTIYGLSENDEVTIKEKEAGADGYTTTYAVTENAGISDNTTGLTNKTMTSGDSTVTVKKTTNDEGTVTITNSKSEITVTGVAMNIAPYAAMVLGAGAFAGIFLGGKRREAEDED